MVCSFVNLSVEDGGGFHNMLSLGWVMDSRVCFWLELWCGDWTCNPRGCFSDVVLHC